MKKILIIDDEADICMLLKRFLSKKDFQVEYATEAAAGLELLDTFLPNLVLCDFRLGKVDGREVLVKIKEKFPHLPVIIMTGYSDIKIAIDVMKLGAFDYLTKPLFPDEIFHIIQKALAAAADLALGETEKTDDDEPQKPADEAKKPRSRKSNLPTGERSIFGTSPISQHLIKQIALVAPTNYSVIIYGESGSGKEVVAREIHRQSKRADKLFIAMDCGAISPQLAGSELFGHEKGSFTGALDQKIGHFELANGGTLFLDEVGNLSYDVQISLLRVVQERKLRRIGGNKEVEIDVRIIVASNEKLWEASRSGKFREDLFHRFNEFSIDVPPLRERREDILMYAHYFLNLTNAELGKNVADFAQDVQDLFFTYPWYGNLRELKNVMKRATLLCDSTEIKMKHLPFEITNYDKVFFTEKAETVARQEPQQTVETPRAAPAKTPISLKSASMEAESEMILKALQQTNFNKSKAAELLNIDRKTLYNKIKFYNL